jgi:hypothetical protein
MGYIEAFYDFGLVFIIKMIINAIREGGRKRDTLYLECTLPLNLTEKDIETMGHPSKYEITYPLTKITTVSDLFIWFGLLYESEVINITRFARLVNQ